MWEHLEVLQCTGPYPGPYIYLQCVAAEGPIWPLAVYEIAVFCLVTAALVKGAVFVVKARRALRRCAEIDSASAD
jgi:hypothetical protein